MSNFLSKIAHVKQLTCSENSLALTHYKYIKYTIRRREHPIFYKNGKKVALRIKEWNIIRPVVSVKFMAGV